MDRMSKIFLPVITTACVLFVSCGKPCCEPPSPDGARGWLSWRGPQQNGVSLETGLPDKWELGGANDLWSCKISGRGTPVVADGKLYVWGYEGEGADLQEVLLCLDAENGRKIWEQRFNDFLSDIVYTRYSIGAPTVDRETGNVYLLTSPGLLVALSADGKKLWEHSTMEELGRLSFPNGRTGSPVIDGDLVIIHGITSNRRRGGPVLCVRQAQRRDCLVEHARHPSAEGQFVLHASARLAERQARALCRHGRRLPGLRQRAHGRPSVALQVLRGRRERLASVVRRHGHCRPRRREPRQLGDRPHAGREGRRGAGGGAEGAGGVEG